MGFALNKISSLIIIVFEFIKKISLRIVDFVNILPTIIAYAIYAGFFFAVISILVAHVKSIILCHGKWRKFQNSSLMYSYLGGTGQYRRVQIYNKLFSDIQDEKSVLISAAGCAYHLGKFKSNSKIKLILLSLIYIPLMIVGFPELLFRWFLGFLYVIIASSIHWLILKIFEIIEYGLIPVWSAIDKGMRTEQHCPNCYRTFRIPNYVCPSCGIIHKNLVPAKTGILVARCECGKFLPSLVLTGRTKLDSVCPECNEPLAVSGAKEFSLQLIGGNSSGKTAYFAAFQHVYRSVHKNDTNVFLAPFPRDKFDELDRMYTDGTTTVSSKTSTVTYSIVHDYADGSKYNLVVYDIPDEVLISGVYEQNPLNFAYSNGILIIIDPTSVRSVRIESEKKGQIIPEWSYASNQNETEDIIIEFIQQFSRLSNRSSNKRIRTPVAVIINKTDLKVVNSKIGKDAVLYKYNENPEKYNDDISYARNTICRDYLISLGMSNAINNLESVFPNVQYFATSAMGHMHSEGKKFSPIDVIEPIMWIAEQNNTKLGGLLKITKKFLDGDDQEYANISGKQEKRYKNAEKLLLSNEFEKAEEEFRLLGNYKDSKSRAESVIECRYKYAKMLFSERKFEEAVEEFTKIKDYKDCKDYIVEALFQIADAAMKDGNYEMSIDMFESLGKYKDADKKCKEAKYLFANRKAANGDSKGALSDFDEIRDYKDSKQKSKQLLPDLIKCGVKRNLSFGNYKWRVLSIDKGVALIVTEKVIRKAAYNEVLKDVVWKDSTLRRFLNFDFLNEFTDEEKKMIFSLVVKNERNSEYGTDSGEDTIDTIFLLSSKEMRELFESDADRIPAAGGEDVRWCWLRTSGGNNSYASIVDAHGTISEGGNSVNNTEGGIRPALWISL